MGLDSVEFVMELEDEFGIRIPDADAEKIRRLGDAVRFISECPEPYPFMRRDEARTEMIRHRVYRVTAEFMRVDIKSLTDETDLVDDLEMD